MTARSARPRRGDLDVRGGRLVDAAAQPIADVQVRAGTVVGVEEAGSGERVPTLDANGCDVVPGFVDLQVNGAFGIDLTSRPDRMSDVAEQLPRYGVTAWCPTVITGPTDVVPDALAAVREARHRTMDAVPGAKLLGLHAEGPFLSPLRPGTHPPEHIRPVSTSELDRWLELAVSDGESPTLALVTLAPEEPGAIDAIDRLVAAGITVCAGHTAASPDELSAAADRGLAGVTHLFNAMPPFDHRRPGPVGATLVSDSLIAGLIVDGLHVDPLAVDLVWRLLGPERTALVTDCMAALGAGSGRFELGDVIIDVADGVARNTDGGLAGSVLSMDEAVRNLMRFTGCSLADASRAASVTPSRLVGADHLGEVAPGRPADLVLLDDEQRVVATVIDGIVVHDPDGRSVPPAPSC